MQNCRIPLQHAILDKGQRQWLQKCHCLQAEPNLRFYLVRLVNAKIDMVETQTVSSANGRILMVTLKFDIHHWDFDEQLHNTFPETAPWEPVASRTSIGWVGLVGLAWEQRACWSFTFHYGSIPSGRNIGNNTLYFLVFLCSSLWLLGQQKVYTSTFNVRLHSGCIILTASPCAVLLHIYDMQQKTNDRTTHPQSHNYGIISASQHHSPFLRNLGRMASNLARQRTD